MWSSPQRGGGEWAITKPRSRSRPRPRLPPCTAAAAAASRLVDEGTAAARPPATLAPSSGARRTCCHSPIQKGDCARDCARDCAPSPETRPATSAGQSRGVRARSMESVVRRRSRRLLRTHRRCPPERGEGLDSFLTHRCPCAREGNRVASECSLEGRVRQRSVRRSVERRWGRRWGRRRRRRWDHGPSRWCCCRRRRRRQRRWCPCSRCSR